MDELIEPVDDGLKRSTNLTLRSRLVRDARQLGINLSAAAEDGIERAVAKARDQQWVERNRGGMASYDAFVEREGLLLEDLRTF
jgi:antitoxin CcdA